MDTVSGFDMDVPGVGWKLIWVRLFNRTNASMFQSTAGMIGWS
jgi:hypothetical protein